MNDDDIKLPLPPMPDLGMHGYTEAALRWFAREAVRLNRARTA